MRVKHTVGVDDIEGPPVPIPNTVVKLNSAENTWAAAPREDKTISFIYFAYLAQLVEHAAVNRRVVGSSPTVGAKINPVIWRGLFVYIYISISQ